MIGLQMHMTHPGLSCFLKIPGAERGWEWLFSHVCLLCGLWGCWNDWPSWGKEVSREGEVH